MAPSSSIFRAPQEIHFGPGVVGTVGEVARRFAKRALVVTGAHSSKVSGALEAVRHSLAAAGVEVVVFDGVAHEPTLALVEEVRSFARSEGCQALIGLGGGSPVDVAKCGAGLFYSAEAVSAHFDGQVEMPDQALPWIAVPTTAGAGAEATPNAVVTDERTNVKKSLRSWEWLAKAAIVDPELTVACPERVTAYSGMDAFTQAVESYTSRNATPLTEGISFEAALQVAKGLPLAYDDGSDLEARTAVAWGATMAGVALANARLGAVHGFAHAVGTACNLPHGLVCAILLPWVIEYNLDVAAEKYARLARGLGVAEAADPADVAAVAFLDHVRALNAKFEIPATLGEVGLEREMIDAIVAQTLPSGSLAANPKSVPKEDLEAILLAQRTERE